LNLVIRDGQPSDSDAVFFLVCEFAVSFRPDREAFGRCLSELISDESAKLIVAESDGDLVGYCLGFDHYAMYANGRISWLEEITVRADLRRRGIGSAMMNAFEVWAESRSSKLVGLATRRAKSFYTALGYDESAVFFRKLLPR
jgi:GNAT superfamily N-acetyltransferase